MKIKKRQNASTEIPSASMSDIAFLLIIFFMLTTVFSQEQGIKYQLPDSTTQVSLEKKPMTIVVDENENITIDDVPATLNDIRLKVSAQKLINKNLFVIIKIAPNAPYKYLIDVIDQVNLGGVDNIAFQSTEESIEDFNFEKTINQ